MNYQNNSSILVRVKQYTELSLYIRVIASNLINKCDEVYKL